MTSLVVMLASLLGPVVRSHWAIENRLHWVLDMVFRDDECWVGTDHAANNFTTIKHMALNLLRRPAGKQSIRGRGKAASWDDEFLASFIKPSPDSAAGLFNAQASTRCESDESQLNAEVGRLRSEGIPTTANV